jgi:hypothetical protein
MPCSIKLSFYVCFPTRPALCVFFGIYLCNSQSIKPEALKNVPNEFPKRLEFFPHFWSSVEGFKETKRTTQADKKLFY